MEEVTKPLVSVIMPVYNGEKYLREAIDSILAQTYENFEFIIVNDGSSDNSKDIILSYSDPRIRYIENPHNSGICVTLNKGLELAKGKYIARMDADDISLSMRLQVQVAYMENHESVGVCGSDIIIFGEGMEERLFVQIHTSEDCVAGLLFNPCFAHPSVMIRKSILDDNKIWYEEEYRGLEDFRMWWNIASYSKINNIPSVLLRYRQHKGQETRNLKPETKAKLNEFCNLRYKTFGLNLTTEQLKVVNDYSNGLYEKIGPAEYTILLNVFSQICKSSNLSLNTTRKAIKKVCGKAVAHVINQSSRLRDHKRRLLTKAVLRGVLLPDWYLRYFKTTF